MDDRRVGRAVVAGVDGSESELQAVRWAARLRAPLRLVAALRRAPLLAVHAWRELLIDPVTFPSLDWAVVEQEDQAELAERLAGWQETYPDIDVQRVVVRDRPARVLVEQSAQAQLVVVGSHGHGGPAGLVLGRSGTPCCTAPTAPSSSSVPTSERVRSDRGTRRPARLTRRPPRSSTDEFRRRRPSH